MKRVYTAGLVAAALGFGATPTHAQPQPRQDLKATAAAIVKEVKALAGNQMQAGVRLGEFKPLGLPRGDGRPALEHELRTAFGTFLNDDAVLELHGEFRYTEVENVVGKVINVKAVLENSVTNKKIKEIDIPILYVHDITRFVGPNGTITGATDSADGLKPSELARLELEAIVKTPTAAAAGDTFATPKPGSPYRVEVRAKKNGTAGRPAPRPVTVANGLPVVKIDAGEVYEVRVLNYAAYEAAFCLSIDGLDQFVFSEDKSPAGQPKYKEWSLPAAKGDKPGEAVIQGWHKKFDPAAGEHSHFEFLTTEFGKGNILNKPKAKVGMIELAFSRSFETEQAAGTRGRDVETSKGTVGKVSGTVIQRFINPPEEFLTIRYNREIK